jgi:hypothetical protein
MAFWFDIQSQLCVCRLNRHFVRGTERRRGKSALWSELKAKREKLASLHQEFDVSETSKTSRSSRTAQRQIVVDMFQGQWRETSVSGPGSRIRIFDRKNLILLAEQGDEYLRSKPQFKDEDPAPFPYPAQPEPNRYRLPHGRGSVTQV